MDKHNIPIHNIMDILGTPYDIYLSENGTDKELEATNSFGYCDPSVKKIVVGDFDYVTGMQRDQSVNLKRVLRHEIIHAFIHESGLGYESEWALNEEMVDFFAMQFEKMARAMKQSKCLDID